MGIVCILNTWNFETRKGNNEKERKTTFLYNNIIGFQELITQKRLLQIIIIIIIIQQHSSKNPILNKCKQFPTYSFF